MELRQEYKKQLRRTLSQHGQRLTRQRQLVYAVLLEARDHPTADSVFERARALLPGISMATVYNCLETLRDCGLIRQVNLQRQASRFCPDDDETHKHAHFFCKRTGKVHDVALTPEAHESLQKMLPDGFSVDEIELSFRGTTPGHAA